MRPQSVRNADATAASTSVSLSRAAAPQSIRTYGVLGSDLDGLVQVITLDQVETQDLLLGLGKWPIGGKGLPVADPHGGSGAGRAQRVAELAYASTVHLLHPLGGIIVCVAARSRVRRGRLHADAGLHTADQQQVPHRSSSGCSLT
jgi:hypothetical protein